MLYDPKWEIEAPVKPFEPWRQLLLDAADYMERKGHAKHNALTVDGRVCFVGALSMAATGGAYNFGPEYLKTHTSVFEKNTPMVQAFKKMADYTGGYPVGWNNDPNRTADEVIRGMRECARSDD